MPSTSGAVAAAGAAVALTLLVAVLVRLGLALSGQTLSGWFVLASVLTSVGVMATAVPGLARHHPFARIGAANLITGLRAVLTALVAGTLVEAPADVLAWTAVALSGVALVLDGVDGWAARRQGLASAFGARFDMEVDALLILVLAALTWRWGKAGAWVLASGLMRYGFVAAAWVWPWCARALPPSRRRQVVCVVQIAGLLLALLPVVPSPCSDGLAALSLAVLTWSFWVDVRWLAARRAA